MPVYMDTLYYLAHVRITTTDLSAMTDNRSRMKFGDVRHLIDYLYPLWR